MTTEGPAKAIAILQSNYIPWKGYFDIIAAVDEFLIFDEVQYTRHDWRNRNKIVQQGKLRWLNIPVETKGILQIPINAVETADPDWVDKHWSEISRAYGHCTYFGWFAPVLEATYLKARGLSRLTEINELFLRALCDLLGLTTPLLRAEQIPRFADDPTGRLVEICQARGAATYVSGPAAKAYLDRTQFDAIGVGVAFTNYSGYPVYDQGLIPFEHGVSILDLMFRFGPEAHAHLKSPRDPTTFLDLAR